MAKKDKRTRAELFAAQAAAEKASDELVLTAQTALALRKEEYEKLVEETNAALAKKDRALAAAQVTIESVAEEAAVLRRQADELKVELEDAREGCETLKKQLKEAEAEVQSANREVRRVEDERTRQAGEYRGFERGARMALEILAEAKVSQ